MRHGLVDVVHHIRRMLLINVYSSIVRGIVSLNCLRDTWRSGYLSPPVRGHIAASPHECPPLVHEQTALIGARDVSITPTRYTYGSGRGLFCHTTF